MSAILGKASGGERIDRRAVCGKGRRESTLRVLCVLCASAVKENEIYLNRRGAENAEATQRNAIDWSSRGA